MLVIKFNTLLRQINCSGSCKQALIILLIITLGCEKNEDFGDSTQEIVDDSDLTSLQIDIFDFSNLDGNLAIAIFNNESDFDSGLDSFLDSIIPVADFNMTILIPHVDPGTYAVSVFHDADESGDITFGGFLSLIPQEGFGFSNNPNIGMSQPSFNDCSFQIEESQTIQVPINLIYL